MMNRLTERNHIYHACEFMDSGVDVYLNKLSEYEDAEEQGLLIKLPCKLGTKVYSIEDSKIYEIYYDQYYLEDGVKIFLTRSEAEQALKGITEDSPC